MVHQALLNKYLNQTVTSILRTTTFSGTIGMIPKNNKLGRTQRDEPKAVLLIRIRIHRIHMFLGLPDPAPDPDPSIIMQK